MKIPLGADVDLSPGHCVRRGPSSPAKGAQQPPLFGPCLLWQRSLISAAAELLFFCCGSCVQSVIPWVARCGLVSELNNAHIISIFFDYDYDFQWLNLAWQFESCVAVFFHAVLEHGDLRFLEDIFHKVGQQRV